MNLTVVHVAHAFSAQPTLGDQLSASLGVPVTVVELPLEEAMAGQAHPDAVWLSEASPDVVRRLRERFPGAALLATLRSTARSEDVLCALACGADLALRDEGVVLAAAALGSVLRRRESAAPRGCVDPALT